VKVEPKSDAQCLSSLRAEPASQPASQQVRQQFWLLAWLSPFLFRRKKAGYWSFGTFYSAKIVRDTILFLRSSGAFSLSVTYHSPILTRSWKEQRDHGLLDGFLKLLMLVLPSPSPSASLSLSLSFSLSAVCTYCLHCHATHLTSSFPKEKERVSTRKPSPKQTTHLLLFSFCFCVQKKETSIDNKENHIEPY
jgi:hypothetical protein